MDRDGRWAIKRGRKAPKPGAEGPVKSEAGQSQLLTLFFGYKNHVGIDREYGFVRTFKVTPAPAHDGAQLGEIWRNFTPEEKKPYEDRASMDRCDSGLAACHPVISCCLGASFPPCP